MTDDYKNSNKGSEMQVKKRNGQMQDMTFDKILMRVKNLGKQAGISANFSALVLKIMDQLYDGIETSKIDELTAQQCATMNSQNPSLGTLAGYVCVSNHQKNTGGEMGKFVSIVRTLGSSLLADDFITFVERHHLALEMMIDYERDCLIDYFGFKTLERSYLMKRDGVVLERPQHMWMRVAVCLHMCKATSIAALERIKETYDLLSQKYFIHATPTLFNAGTRHPQLSSCYLIAMEEDSINGIYNTLKDCANISKWAGGIGLHVHNVRAAGSPIHGTNGSSTGLVPMLKVYNSTARYCNQGGKRNGSFAIYLEPWHADIEEFLQMKRNQGDEEMKARDLFYALWISDLFMERVRDDAEWHLFCPNKAPGLSKVHNGEFRTLYARYVSECRYDRVVKARDLWLKILDSQMETSAPYLLYKDAVNAKCNQSNLGTIQSSNLCTEITLYSDANETAGCNLASGALNMFVKKAGDDEGDGALYYDYDGLQRVVRVITRNLNQVIDRNFYPTEKTRRSNFLHRPIGIGVQGLADCFIQMGYSFESEEAASLNRCIFEVMYFAALSESCELAKERKADMMRLKRLYSDVGKERGFHFRRTEPHCREYSFPDGAAAETVRLVNEVRPVFGEFFRLDDTYVGAYSSYIGSPMHKGMLQFDMWAKHQHDANSPRTKAHWAQLRQEIEMHGVRNSMLMAPMPTASTSQILGNNECFEPYTSNIYTRRTMAGEFIVINRHMVRELIEMGVWSEEIKDHIIANRGSVQHIGNISDDFKSRYKTVWEISMKTVINMARDRGAYICQSQSMNLWVEDPNYAQLSSMHFYSWKQGLKTGIYYLRRKPKHHPQQFTIQPKDEASVAAAPAAGAAACPYRPRRQRGSSADADTADADADDQECLACGS